MSAISDALVIVGDTLLDVDLSGSADKLCPDDPAPVLTQMAESARPGGAGLAALLAARTGPVVLITALGADEHAERLRSMLEPRVELIDLGADHTVIKTRVRSGGRTLLRMDRVERSGFPIHTGHTRVRDAVEAAPAILVSDYGYGLTSNPAIRAHLVNRTVVWDPHPRGAPPVAGVTTVTPNADEAEQMAQIPGNDLSSAIRQATHLCRQWQAASVCITRGREGALTCSEHGNPVVVPTQRTIQADTCGAGDAFAVGLTSALAQGSGLVGAVEGGVGSAGTFLAAGGVSSLFTEQSVAPQRSDPQSAEEVVARVRAANGTIVMAGGCFDLLHAGHVSYLQAARDLGDCLVVAVNSDDSVRRLKGPQRPLVPVEDRARILRALGCVDAVVVFDESTPERVLDQFRPDIFAKGGDYADSFLPETPVVHSYGGQIVVLPSLAGRSSTGLLHAARAGTGSHVEQEEQCQTQSA
jgi:rfaE bifunctional protein nucleotidyltransferase chain/domain/rfaE bifunctional protein kinase chain/domain